MTDDETWRRFWADAETLGTTRWFGASWRVPGCAEATRIATPVGGRCTACGCPIRDGDQGVRFPLIAGAELGFAYYHRACWVAVLESVR